MPTNIRCPNSIPRGQPRRDYRDGFAVGVTYMFLSPGRYSLFMLRGWEDGRSVRTAQDRDAQAIADQNDLRRNPQLVKLALARIAAFYAQYRQPGDPDIAYPNDNYRVRLNGKLYLVSYDNGRITHIQAVQPNDWRGIRLD